MNKLNIKKIEDPNLWLYENVLNSSTKTKAAKIFNNEFKKKAAEKLKGILKDCRKYDKELKELNNIKQISFNNLHPNKKLDINSLTLNQFGEKSEKINLKYFLNGYNKSYVDHNLKKYNVEKNKKSLEEIKKNDILKQLKEIKKGEFSKNYSFFLSHVNYYDTYLKEKYMNEFLHNYNKKSNLEDFENLDKSNLDMNFKKTDDEQNSITKKSEVKKNDSSINRKYDEFLCNSNTLDLSNSENNIKSLNSTNYKNINEVDNNINNTHLNLKNNIDVIYKNNIYDNFSKKLSENSHNISEYSNNLNKKKSLNSEDSYSKIMKLNKFNNNINNLNTIKKDMNLLNKNNTFKEDIVKENENNVENLIKETSKNNINKVNSNFKEKNVDVDKSNLEYLNKEFNNNTIRSINNEFKETIVTENESNLEYLSKNSFNNFSNNDKYNFNEIKIQKNESAVSNKENTIYDKRIENNEKNKIIKNKKSHFNNLSIFEKINSASLYRNIDDISKTDNENIAISTILFDLREKKKKIENIENTEHPNKSSNEKCIFQNKEYSDMTSKIKKEINEEQIIKKKVYISNKDEKSEICNLNNHSLKKSNNFIKQYEYLDSNNITVNSLSHHLNIDKEKIINVCKYILDNDYINKNTRLEKEVVELLCEELNVLDKLKYSSINLKKRNPIVTILGHVDHGKTTLLDQFRNSNIAKNEIGGITQKLGAFEVLDKKTNRKITFLDTPGHSVFKKIRQRCVQCTDLIVLVISIDDGIMSETIECIELTKKYNIPLIIAANKIDKYNCNLDKISKSLLNYDIVTELENGEVPLVPISAKKNINIDLLQKTILNVSDKLNLMCDYGSLCSAYLLEKRVDPVKGKSLTVICKSGTLKVNSYLLIGHSYTKIKKIINCDGKVVKEAYPSEVVQITSSISFADDNIKYGDLILEMSNLKSAQKISKYKLKMAQYNLINNYYLDIDKEKMFSSVEKKRNSDILNKKEHSNNINERNMKKNDLNLNEKKIQKKKKNMMEINSFKIPQIHLIIKTCDEGSMDAIIEGINDYNKKEKKEKYCDINNFIDRNYVNKNIFNDETELSDFFEKWEPFKIITKGIGTFNINDLKYCEHVKPCFLIGFNIDVDNKIQHVIENNNVILRTHNIIYELFQDIENICNFYFDSMYVYEIVSRMVITKTGYYTLKKNKAKKKVLSVDIKEGSFNIKNYFTVLRNKQLIHDKITILSMQKNKQNTTELTKTNNDNAIIFNTNVDNFETGDEIIAYKKVTRPPLFNKIKNFDLSF
ncbi:translation initiation factor IF-2, putative [Plasmodium gallinaceum]|uniref:Translation initiation factor IF-2, putative n=1 Tax=Plasmodium gallinaceum TaxID=5849 RepID=A0A1J1GM34_PLAGA|nr:translation initiation factor IF-2, putative [Plasmodium gallinaceum]CRG93496.1 translation initiation factor IF-2, putative [Plasmodium gallinaceum]